MEGNNSARGPWQRHILILNARGWNMKQIANVAGCEPSTITRLKRGETKKPGKNLARALERMAKGLE